jgi:acetyl-CoA C-acetyltransferase
VNDFHMGMSAELVAEKYGISREEMDQFAFESYRRTWKAIEEGKFREEIVPVEVVGRKGEIKVLTPTRFRCGNP